MEEKIMVGMDNHFKKEGPEESLHMWITEKNSVRIRLDMPGVSSGSFTARLVDKITMVVEGSETLMKHIIDTRGEEIRRVYQATFRFDDLSNYLLHHFRAEVRNGVCVIDIQRSKKSDDTNVTLPLVKELVNEKGAGVGSNPLILGGKDRVFLVEASNDVLIIGIDVPGLVQGDEEIEVEGSGISFRAVESERHPLEFGVEYTKRVYGGYIPIRPDFNFDAQKLTSIIENGILWITLPQNLEEEEFILEPFKMVSDFSSHIFESTPFPQSTTTNVLDELRDMEIPEGICIRAFYERNDLLRVGVVGPEGSPHFCGFFVYDVQILPTYPHSPPLVFDYMHNNKYIIDHNMEWDSLGDRDPVGFRRVLRYIKDVVLGGGVDNHRMHCWLSLVRMLHRPPKHFEEILENHCRVKGSIILKDVDAFIHRKGLGKPEVKPGEDGESSTSKFSKSHFQGQLQGMLEWLLLQLYPKLMPLPIKDAYAGYPVFKVLNEASYSVLIDPPSQPNRALVYFDHLRLSNNLRSLQTPVFVRTWKDRPDLFSVMVVGPSNTPYEDGVYIFDIQLPPGYPEKPPVLVFRQIGKDNIWISPVINEGVVDLPVLRNWTIDHSVFDVVSSIVGDIFVQLPLNIGRNKIETSSAIINSLEFDHVLAPNIWSLMIAILKSSPLVFHELIHKHFSHHRSAIMGKIAYYHDQQLVQLGTDYVGALFVEFGNNCPVEGEEYLGPRPSTPESDEELGGW